MMNACACGCVNRACPPPPHTHIPAIACKVACLAAQRTCRDALVYQPASSCCTRRGRGVCGNRVLLALLAASVTRVRVGGEQPMPGDQGQCGRRAAHAGGPGSVWEEGSPCQSG